MIRKTFCFICALVVTSWVTLLALMWMGYTIDKILIAALMGMSVGAVATKYINVFALKTSFVVFGLLVIWFLLKDRASYASFAFIALISSYLLQYKFNPRKGEQLSDKFKDCC